MEMNRKQQAKLFEGKDHWHLNSEKDVTFSDGPNGLRIEDETGIGFNHSRQATLFPTAVSAGCSFDRALMEEYGRMIAEECIGEHVDVILGPGVNHKRSPLCGRNFEYFSEDPILSGELAASYINGAQSLGIGTSLKHFAANSRELGRQVQDSIVDERTLHELYLRQFEIAIRQSHPWTLMAAYNRINGVYCCENKKLFEEARSWGFDGALISDWGGISDPVQSIKNGLNLEMPGQTGSAEYIEKAVESGEVSEECLKKSTEHLQKLIDRCGHGKGSYDQKDHDVFCLKAAEESIVLLKNDGVLPLTKTDTLAVIGPLAEHPNIQGSGSARVNARNADSLLEVLDANGIHYTYAQGYSMDHDTIDQSLHQEALQAAEGKDKVIVLVGETGRDSGEGFDRSSMDLALNQNTLIRDLAQVSPHVILVTQTGSPITLSWRDKVAGIIAEYEAGAKSGEALRRILYGEVNPSGHLAETWPLRNEDIPCARYYDTSVMQTQYREGIFSGYRYYDTYHVPVAYPFGHGLSYTAFAYTDLHINKNVSGIEVSFMIENTGDRTGRTVAQIYAGMENSRIARPAKELRDFISIELAPGEKKEISSQIPYTSFQYYDVQKHSWQIEKGIYTIMVGESVETIVLQGTVAMDGIEDPFSTLSKEYLQYDAGMVYVKDEDFETMLGHAIPPMRSPRPFTPDTTIRELKACGLGKVVNFGVARVLNMKVLHGVDDASVYNAPIRQMLWLREHYTWKSVYAAVAYFNHHGIKEWNALIHSLRKPK